MNERGEIMTGEVCQTQNWIKNDVHSIENACPNRIRSGAPVNATGVFDLFHSDDSGRLVHARRARAPPSWFSYVERRRHPGVGRNTHLAMNKSNQLVEPNASKNPFFHFGFCSFSTLVSPSSSPFLLSFPYPVTISVTLLHCNVRGFARGRICWTFNSRLGDQKLWRYVSPES